MPGSVKLGYFIIAVLYLMLAAKEGFTETGGVLYLGIAVTYILLSELVDVGVKLD